MKKDRNSFFNESSFQQSYSSSMPNFAMPNYNMNNQGYYPTAVNNDYSDIESRLAKIERQINRIESRLSRIEAMNTTTTENFDTTNNMYML